MAAAASGKVTPMPPPKSKSENAKCLIMQRRVVTEVGLLEPAHDSNS